MSFPATEGIRSSTLSFSRPASKDAGSSNIQSGLDNTLRPSSIRLSSSPLVARLSSPSTYALGRRSSHPELSFAFAPASFSSASDILSFAGGSSSDESEAEVEGVRIEDIEEELTEEEDVCWRDDVGGEEACSAGDDDRRHHRQCCRPPLRGRRSRDFSSDSTAALLARQASQQSFEAACWTERKDGRAAPHTHVGRLAPPMTQSRSPSPKHWSRSNSRSHYCRPGSPIMESATSASEDSPPRADLAPVHQPIATPPPRSVRFNPRMKTRTAYGSYQSDASTDLLSASPTVSFISWRYPHGRPKKRSGSVISAKRAPAVANWTSYYGALDNASNLAITSYSSTATPSTSSPQPLFPALDPPEAFGATLWQRLTNPSYWVWKMGLDDWAENGCCALPGWAADEEELWGNAGGGPGPGRGGRGYGVGEGRAGAMF